MKLEGIHNVLRPVLFLLNYNTYLFYLYHKFIYLSLINNNNRIYQNKEIINIIKTSGNVKTLKKLKNISNDEKIIIQKAIGLLRLVFIIYFNYIYKE